jgi:hypothetical protein
MFGKLKALITGGSARRRDRIADEYSNMSADERKTADAMRNRGPEGERERIVEHKADQYIDAEEGRPREN